MGTLSDIFDSVGDAIEDVGDFVGDTVEAVLDNPVGALVTAGSLALGIPPVYAGALGGASNAAANGGNILEGALLGGATSYVGGAGAGLAADAGAGTILSGAAGGAASGLTGAVLTGGDIGKSILSGGLVGGAVGTYYDMNGSPISSSNQAPVYEYDAASGQIVPVGTAAQVGVQPGSVDNSGLVYPDTTDTYDYSGGLDNGPVQPTEQPYDPYTDEGPSQPGVETGGPVDPNAPVIEITDTRVPTSTPPNVAVLPGTEVPYDATEIPHGDGVTPDTPTVVPPGLPSIITTTPSETEAPAETSARRYVTAEQRNIEGAGLNPGFIQATPFYNTTNDVQSQYYWGGHGYQMGPTFDANQYNSVAAPQTPWGLQQQMHPLTADQYHQLITNGTYQPEAQTGPATRAVAYNPVQPVAPEYGQVGMTPTYGYTIQQ